MACFGWWLPPSLRPLVGAWRPAVPRRALRGLLCKNISVAESSSAKSESVSARNSDTSASVCSEQLASPALKSSRSDAMVWKTGSGLRVRSLRMFVPDLAGELLALCPDPSPSPPPPHGRVRGLSTQPTGPNLRNFTVGIGAGAPRPSRRSGDLTSNCKLCLEGLAFVCAAIRFCLFHTSLTSGNSSSLDNLSAITARGYVRPVKLAHARCSSM